LLHLLQPAARIVVELLLRDQPVAVAVDDHVGRAQPPPRAREVEMDAHERRLLAGHDGALDGAVGDRLQVADGERDELEHALDALDAGRPAEEPHRGARVHDVRMIERPREREIAGREGAREALLLGDERGLADHLIAARLGSAPISVSSCSAAHLTAMARWRALEIAYAVCCWAKSGPAAARAAGTTRSAGRTTSCTMCCSRASSSE